MHKFESGLDIVKGLVGERIATILRDTGSSTVFVNSRLVDESCRTGKENIITLAD